MPRVLCSWAPAPMLPSLLPFELGSRLVTRGGPASFVGPAPGEGTAVPSTEMAPGLARARTSPACPQGRCALGPAGPTWHPASPWGLGSPASDMTWCEARGPSAWSSAWLLVSLSSPRPQCGSRPHGPDSGQGARDPRPRGCGGARSAGPGVLAAPVVTCGLGFRSLGPLGSHGQGRV